MFRWNIGTTGGDGEKYWRKTGLNVYGESGFSRNHHFLTAGNFYV